MSRGGRAVPLLLLLLLLGGCAHYLANARLGAYRADGGYRFDPLLADGRADELFVCLSFSGGGTRAAALAYGVMQRLREIRAGRPGAPASLLDEVDCISAVSGGSFTAAYYALFGDDLFRGFYERFLIRDLHRELVARVASPLNWFRLASPYFSRVDLAAELYDETIFAGRRFAALVERRRRPFVILNATNMATGDRFEFTQEQFDFLGSDLASYPIGRAVAASSAFPFLLSPISLRNHGPAPGFALPAEYANALASRELNAPRYHWALHRTEYARDPQRLPYLHLMDGGLADNIGLRAILTAYERSNGFIGPRINAGRIKRLVIIVVNARTDPPEHLSRRESPPGLVTVGLKTATVSMENYSVETIEAMKRLQREREQAEQSLLACRRLLEACPAAEKPPFFAGAVKTCVVEVGFDAIAEPERRRRFLGLPTTFALPRPDVDDLIRVGGELLERSPDFQRLLRALTGEREPGAGIGERGNCS